MVRRRTRRKFTPRRRRAGGKAWYDRKYSPGELAQKALTGVYYLKGLVNSELFKNDISGNVSTMTTTGMVIPMTSIAQGDAVAGRTGNSIFVRSINMKVYFFLNPSTIGTVFRMAIIKDNQQLSDTTPTITEIYAAASPSVTAPLNVNTAGRFSVLKSWFFAMDDSKTQFRLINHYHILRHHVRYNGTSGSDVQKGGLYLVIWCNEATNAPTVQYDIRTSYHDN